MRGIGLDVNAVKNKQIAMSRDQNAVENHNIKIYIVPLKECNSSNILLVVVVFSS
jgi:hypothetical protein